MTHLRATCACGGTFDGDGDSPVELGNRFNEWLKLHEGHDTFKPVQGFDPPSEYLGEYVSSCTCAKRPWGFEPTSVPCPVHGPHLSGSTTATSTVNP